MGVVRHPPPLLGDASDLEEVPSLPGPPFETGRWRKVKSLSEAGEGCKVILASNQRPQEYPRLPQVFAVVRRKKASIGASAGVTMEAFQNELHVRDLGGVCPNIVETYGVWQDNEFVYIVTEHCAKGDLHTAWLEQTANKAANMTANTGSACGKDVVRQILTTMAALHSNGYSHKGISMESFRVADGGEVKLVDFFGVRPTGPGDPEGDQAFAADILQVGKAIFALLVGEYPVHSMEAGGALADGRRATLGPQLRARGREGQVPPLCVDLLERLLAPLPEHRPTAAAALEHPWLARPAPGAPASAPEPVPTGMEVPVSPPSLGADAPPLA